MTSSQKNLSLKSLTVKNLTVERGGFNPSSFLDRFSFCAGVTLSDFTVPPGDTVSFTFANTIFENNLDVSFAGNSITVTKKGIYYGFIHFFLNLLAPATGTVHFYVLVDGVTMWLSIIPLEVLASSTELRTASFPFLTLGPMTGGEVLTFLIQNNTTETLNVNPPPTLGGLVIRREFCQ